MKNIINFKDQTYYMWPFKTRSKQKQFGIITAIGGVILLLLQPFFPISSLFYVLGVLSSGLGLIYLFEAGFNAPE